MVGKRGWIRIVEAFVSILILLGVILFVVDRGSFNTSEDSAEVYDMEISVLREIELNDQLRSEAILIDETKLSNPMDVYSPDFPVNIKKKVLERVPEYLNCTANICLLRQVCPLNQFVEADVYAQSVAITANITNYNPRQVKMFCWFK